jgi:DNA repair photolyase
MILKATLSLLLPFASASPDPRTAPARIHLRLPRVSPERRLRRAALRGRPVVLGTPAAPYVPGGRSPLAALEGVEGLEISVVTRSPEITGELGLLADLDRRCSVTVDLLLPAADALLAWKLDPEGPAPRARLDAVARLAAEGIAVRVLCRLVDGVNDGEAALRKLLAAARDAGASDVHSLPTPHSRLRPHRETGAALDTFRRLRLEYGFPRQMPGRG